MIGIVETAEGNSEYLFVLVSARPLNSDRSDKTFVAHSVFRGGEQVANGKQSRPPRAAIHPGECRRCVEQLLHRDLIVETRYMANAVYPFLGGWDFRQRDKHVRWYDDEVI